ncbi:hypothetical protein T07_7686 [Trichinella nelsoni]|uniref:Uncharacterized protein n=1 Tax=Trichinella nelsoni TaxID=6336 RepID=A0A0V0RLD1_9BILA|nr:hypothetical protein T07_7686 [Trichinella nelsoni]
MKMLKHYLIVCILTIDTMIAIDAIVDDDDRVTTNCEKCKTTQSYVGHIDERHGRESTIKYETMHIEYEK